jgi:hypothetical protein
MSTEDSSRQSHLALSRNRSRIGCGWRSRARIIKHKYDTVQKNDNMGAHRKDRTYSDGILLIISHTIRFIHKDGIQQFAVIRVNVRSTSRGIVTYKGRRRDESNIDTIPDPGGSFRSVLGEQLYNFLLLWTAGYL